MRNVPEECTKMAALYVRVKPFRLSSHQYDTTGWQSLGLIEQAVAREFQVVADRVYVALFPALEQTHCTLVACDSK